MSGEYIDVTPTWEGLVSEMLRILPHATPEGARDIHKQILKAARVADLHVAKVAAESGPEWTPPRTQVPYAPEPNPYTLCVRCQGTAHEDEGYTIGGRLACLPCYHEHCAGVDND